MNDKLKYQILICTNFTGLFLVKQLVCNEICFWFEMNFIFKFHFWHGF